MKIIFSGGYTLGPVTPLLAVYDVLKKKYPQAEFVWVGTKKGPERKLVEQKGLKFFTISSGKLRRYLSLWNVVDIFRLFVGFFQSLVLVWQEKPDLCISAGGFISVPLHWAAWFFGIPTWIHQQDVEVGMSNYLMAPLAKIITTALEINVKNFSSKKTIWLGNPVRDEILQGNVEMAKKFFNLHNDLPVVFVTGGGTGSLRLNQLVIESIQHLRTICQVIHLSGLERPQAMVAGAQKLFPECYHLYQFFNAEEMQLAYAAADLVISRGGFGTLTEIAALQKPAIIIPKPGHQEENVGFLTDAGAVIMVNETIADGNYLAKVVKELLGNQIKQKQLSVQLSKMLPLAKEEKILEVLEKLVG